MRPAFPLFPSPLPPPPPFPLFSPPPPPFFSPPPPPPPPPPFLTFLGVRAPTPPTSPCFIALCSSQFETAMTYDHSICNAAR
ncbi:MAG: hypothetical protein IPI30_18400 [Saprospiraceae bacterium]|nr:hypothetical protein [Candidatus Vicinibacter affinis]